MIMFPRVRDARFEWNHRALPVNVSTGEDRTIPSVYCALLVSAMTKPHRQLYINTHPTFPCARYAYNVVPHPMEQKREGKFTLRIFSKNNVCVEPVAETHTVVSQPATFNRLKLNLRMQIPRQFPSSE